jgi:hypothetical protein
MTPYDAVENSSSRTIILDANVLVNDSTLNDFPTKIIVPPWFLPCSFHSQKNVLALLDYT